jgi:hypothetical protein
VALRGFVQLSNQRPSDLAGAENDERNSLHALPPLNWDKKKLSAIGAKSFAVPPNLTTAHARGGHLKGR